MSGSRNGTTTLSACWASGPESRSTTTSPAPASPATRNCAPRRAVAPGSPSSTTITRHGSAWPAGFAAAIESATRDESVPSAAAPGTMIRVSTRPIVTAPTSSRTWSRRLLIAVVVVSGSSRIIGAAPVARRARRSRPPPFAAGARQHPHRRLRAPAAGRVRVGPAVAGPPVEHRVENLPGQLHLGADREQRRLPEQHVEDEPLVGLGGVLGERRPVGEVHVDVADLHQMAGHLGAEPQRDALIGLHPDHQGVLAE